MDRTTRVLCYVLLVVDGFLVGAILPALPFLLALGQTSLVVFLTWSVVAVVVMLVAFCRIGDEEG